MQLQNFVENIKLLIFLGASGVFSFDEKIHGIGADDVHKILQLTIHVVTLTHINILIS